jgi:hypothetical protein
MLCRRSLVASAMGGAVAWLTRDRLALRVASHGRPGLISASSDVTALFPDSVHSKTIGKACLGALPPMETTIGCLTRVIFGDMAGLEGNRSPANALVQSIRIRSRDDFRDGRVVTVDGWMLSLTETRIYALAALLPSSRGAEE